MNSDRKHQKQPHTGEVSGPSSSVRTSGLQTTILFRYHQMEIRWTQMIKQPQTEDNMDVFVLEKQRSIPASYG